MSTNDTASDLPDRDPTKTNAQQGLYGKFRIGRTDGSSAPGGKHHGCEYFVLDVTHDKHAAVALAAYAGAVAATHPQLAADMRSRWGLPAQPAGGAALPVVAVYSPDEPVDEDGDVRMPVVDLGDDEMLAHKRRIRTDRRFDGLVSQRDAQAAIAARDALVAGLEAAQARIDALEHDWKDRARTDVGVLLAAFHQEVWDAATAVDEGRPPVDYDLAGVETARSVVEAMHARDMRIASLEAEGAKSERRALTFGDALHRNILAMRAAVVAWQRGKARDGMAWISNTLSGPGNFPGDADIALGAQELFDKEVAEHEAFRAANPGPAAPAPRDTAAMLAVLPDHLAASEAAEPSGEEP